MAALIPVDALGALIGIDPSALGDTDAAAVEQAWRGAAAPGRGGDPVSVVAAPAGLPAARMLESLTRAVTLAAIEARRGELWMLHAAAVADDRGRVAVLVGPSGRGKTTAAGALGRTFGYLTDESVGIDAAGRVHPYRKPLSVRTGDGSGRSEREPGALGLRPLPAAPLQLAAVVLLDRDPGAAGAPDAEVGDAGDAAAELVAQTSYLADLPAPLRTVAGHVAAVGGAWRVRYREAEQLAPVIRALLDDAPVRPGAAGRRLAASPVTDLWPRAAGPGDGPRYSRVPVADAVQLREPDRILTLSREPDGEHRVRMLAGIGPALWRAASAASPARLLEAAVAAYGTDERVDAATAAARATTDLVAQRVLTAEEVWRVDEDAAWVRRGDRVTVLALSDLERPAARALEGSAAVIWQQLAAAPGVSARELAERVAREVDVDAAVVAGDVRVFLDVLRAAGLARVS